MVPESLPERFRTGQKISWDKIDPFAVGLSDQILFIKYFYINSLSEILLMIVLFILFVLLYFYHIFLVSH